MKPRVRFSFFYVFGSSKGNLRRFYLSSLQLVSSAVRKPLNVSRTSLWCSYNFYFPWDHWRHFEMLENYVPLKPVLGNVYMQFCILDYCIWRASMKPTQQAHNVETTSIQRWFNVLTLNQLWIDVVSTLCARWVDSNSRSFVCLVFPRATFFRFLFTWAMVNNF